MINTIAYVILGVSIGAGILGLILLGSLIGSILKGQSLPDNEDGE